MVDDDCNYDLNKIRLFEGGKFLRIIFSTKFWINLAL